MWSLVWWRSFRTFTSATRNGSDGLYRHLSRLAPAWAPSCRPPCAGHPPVVYCV